MYTEYITKLKHTNQADLMIRARLIHGGPVEAYKLSL